MAEVVLDCPHCNAEREGFEFGGELPGKPSSAAPFMWNTLFVCHKCRKGVVVRLSGPRFGAKPSACQGDPRHNGFELLAVLPKRQPEIPRYLPDEEIKREYKQAVNCVRQGNFEAAGTMFRKVLQRATTALAAGNEITFKERENLPSRINKLAQKNLITPAMRDWAHQIRDDGNEATHGEDGSFRLSSIKSFNPG